jgi:hypothetical protein
MHDNQVKSISSNYSSNELARLSVPPERAELFLERWANLDITNVEVYARRRRAFRKTFADLLPSHTARLIPPEKMTLKDYMDRTLIGDKEYFIWAEAQPMLRRIWKEPAPLLKEAGMMMLAATYMKECELSGETIANAPYGAFMGFISGPDKFLIVLLHALKHVHLLRYCANPECKEPYFVARRGSQIYCSSPCAKPAQTEAKLKWWREHGAKRRKKARTKRGKNAKAKKA